MAPLAVYAFDWSSIPGALPFLFPPLEQGIQHALTLIGR
jgi:hypothetical protein